MSTVASVSTAGWLPPLTRAASREKAAPAPESAAAVVDISGKGKLLQALQESEERFQKYENRLNPYMRTFLTLGDRRVIGEAYQMAEDKGRSLEKIDELVHELGALRIQQHMNGELVVAVVNQSRDEDAVLAAFQESDLAHLPLLGEMKRMSGTG